MPIFFLTPDNCAFVKNALRKRLDHVKSAHLTEALASAFGFRTHAALLAAMGAWDSKRPSLISVVPSHLRSRLQELGYAPVDPAVLIEVLRAPEIPFGTWREFRNIDVATNNLWYRECEQRNIPNVYIQLRAKYAEVNWDCISIDQRDESHVRGEAASALVNEMFKRYQALARGNPAKSIFSGSAFVGSVDRLSPAIARDIADDFFMRLYMPMARQAAA